MSNPCQLAILQEVVSLNLHQAIDVNNDEDYDCNDGNDNDNEDDIDDDDDDDNDDDSGQSGFFQCATKFFFSLSSLNN